MSVFIPQEWEEEIAYATQSDLLNYLEKQSDGSVDMENKRLVNLGTPANDSDGVNKDYADTNYAAKNSRGHINAKRRKIIHIANPESDTDAVSLGYFNQNNHKPWICVTGEATGALQADSYPFSYGAKSYQYVASNKREAEARNIGFVMPTGGTLKYITARARKFGESQDLPIWVTATLNGDPLNDKYSEGEALSIILELNNRFITPVNINLNAGDILSFHNRWPGPQISVAIASMFIELDV